MMVIPSKKETKKEAIERLLKEHKEIYAVTNILIADDTVGTQLWNLYGSLDDAFRWIRLVMQWYDIPEVIGLKNYDEVMSTGKTEFVFNTVSRGIKRPVQISQRFVVERIVA